MRATLTLAHRACVDWNFTCDLQHCIYRQMEPWYDCDIDVHNADTVVVGNERLGIDVYIICCMQLQAKRLWSRNPVLPCRLLRLKVIPRMDRHPQAV